MRTFSTGHGRVARLALVALLGLGAASCASSSRKPVPPPNLVERSPAEELYQLSSARIHLRRLAPQGLRLLAPHWTQVRESDRNAVQVAVVSTLAEDRVAPFVRAELDKAVSAHPEQADAALEWLRSPVGYEIKFSEATAWSGEAGSDSAFYATVADVRERRAPEIRLERVRRLADATGELAKALDLTAAVGTVMARLVNVSRAGTEPLSLTTLEAVIEKEKARREVIEAYEPVVLASLLVRYRDIDLQELDSYIDFSQTEAGRWYHDTMAAALVAGVNRASMDVEGVLRASFDDDAEIQAAGGNLDSLLVDLPSGSEVRFLTFGRGGTSARPAIMLRYETSLSLANRAAVDREAAEVWDKVRGQFESEGARAAVLQATGSVTGWVFPFAVSRKFAWERDEDGGWSVASVDDPSFSAAMREMLWSVPP